MCERWLYACSSTNTCPCMIKTTYTKTSGGQPGSTRKLGEYWHQGLQGLLASFQAGLYQTLGIHGRPHLNPVAKIGLSPHSMCGAPWDHQWAGNMGHTGEGTQLRIQVPTHSCAGRCWLHTQGQASRVRAMQLVFRTGRSKTKSWGYYIRT